MRCFSVTDKGLPFSISVFRLVSCARSLGNAVSLLFDKDKSSSCDSFVILSGSCANSLLFIMSDFNLPSVLICSGRVRR